MTGFPRFLVDSVPRRFPSKSASRPIYTANLGRILLVHSTPFHTLLVPSVLSSVSAPPIRPRLSSPFAGIVPPSLSSPSVSVVRQSRCVGVLACRRCRSGGASRDSCNSAKANPSSIAAAAAVAPHLAASSKNSQIRALLCSCRRGSVQFSGPGLTVLGVRGRGAQRWLPPPPPCRRRSHFGGSGGCSALRRFIPASLVSRPCCFRCCCHFVAGSLLYTFADTDGVVLVCPLTPASVQSSVDTAYCLGSSFHFVAGSLLYKFATSDTVVLVCSVNPRDRTEKIALTSPTGKECYNYCFLTYSKDSYIPTNHVARRKGT
ncbi:uncharacterized protein [Miscanthus floridulus]|uniref:uncharacterized protein n=1 Tax=Miscanthus floridulus TaxID=154761 RepID=UPI00345997C7